MTVYIPADLHLWAKTFAARKRKDLSWVAKAALCALLREQSKGSVLSDESRKLNRDLAAIVLRGMEEAKKARRRGKLRLVVLDGERENVGARKKGGPHAR